MDCLKLCHRSLIADNYGSFGDDNTSDEDDDSDNNDNNDYYESGEPLEKFPDPDNYYPEFGVPNVGWFF